MPALALAEDQREPNASPLDLPPAAEVDLLPVREGVEDENPDFVQFDDKA